MDRQVVSRIDVPMPFPFDTSEQQAQAMLNYFTHRFASEDGDIRCIECDCRTTHKAALYPCGEEPPRMTRIIYSDGTKEEVLNVG
jgi:hypothetical protein